MQNLDIRDTTSVAGSNVITQEYRDRYDALHNYPQEVQDLVKAVVDEAGYDLGTAKLTANKLESRTVDVYGYDLSRNLAVVQFRRTISDRRPNRFGTVQKRYALIGQDDGQLFCHIAQSSPRRMHGISETSPESVVRWSESKIFGVPMDKLDKITRQGDVALVPIRSIPSGAKSVMGQDFTLRESHQVMVDGNLYRHNGDYIIDGMVELVHTKGQHRPVSGEGKFRIVVGERGGAGWLGWELGD